MQRGARGKLAFERIDGTDDILEQGSADSTAGREFGSSPNRYGDARET
jgi:hypothetical protein